MLTVARLPVAVVLPVAMAVCIRGPAATGGDDSVRLAKVIDQRLAEHWAAADVQPRELVDDRAFLRRVSLDVIGRIPTVAEVRSFEADDDPQKRRRLVARLLRSTGHARHAAVFWRRTWLPQTDTPPAAALANEAEFWVAYWLRQNASYDLIVRKLLIADDIGSRADHGTRPSLPLFLAANEARPDLLAASATGVLLGLNLGCAQCHDHPFARWTHEQFWQTAAFFTGPKHGTDGAAKALELVIPDSDDIARPKLLSGGDPKWPEQLRSDTGRVVLAQWITSPDNPWFAKNAVNRVWAHYFGRGLIEPPDDLTADHPGDHRRLLDELAAAFVESGFDLRHLTESILLTDAYQRTTAHVPGPRSSPKTQIPGSIPVRALTGEQMYDSLRTAAGLPLERTDLSRHQAWTVRAEFAQRFRIDRPASAERSIVQALALMNGELTMEATSVHHGPTLHAIAGAPFLDDSGRLDLLFLATLARPPSGQEIQMLMPLLQTALDQDTRREALSGIFWALVNSVEFNTNH